MDVHMDVQMFFGKLRNVKKTILHVRHNVITCILMHVSLLPLNEHIICLGRKSKNCGVSSENRVLFTLSTIEGYVNSGTIERYMASRHVEDSS